MSKLVNITVDVVICRTKHVKVKAASQAEFEIQLDILGSNKYCHNSSSFFFNVYIFQCRKTQRYQNTLFNPLNPELNPICYLLALLAQHFLHVSRISVKSLTLRLLMSYIYGTPILDVSRSHTTTQHSR